MYAKGARFITARRHYAAVAGATDQNRFAIQPRIEQALTRHKKGVEVHMHD
jgi:hypothetical protein